MSHPLIQTYRRLDLLQRTMLFRIVASVVALLVSSGVFGTLIYTSSSIDSQRTMLYSALENQSLERRDEHAVSLYETGQVTVGGRTYSTDQYAASPEYLFDEQGRIAVPAAVVEDLLAGLRPQWAPMWLIEQPDTTRLLAIVFTVWLLLIVWIDISLPFALTVLATGTAAGLLWLGGREQAMVAVLGIGLLTFTYVLLTRAALVLFGRPNQILAVAHTVIKEASRSRISLVFIVLLLVLLPLIPIWLDPEAPLRFRVQTFISRSLNLTYVLAAFMTLFLACGTVAFEIRDRQIWQIMTKPTNRFNYLLGKWLGVVTVNLILLTIAGVSTFTFIQYLRTQPVAPGIEGQLDAMQVNDDVLTARTPARPEYDRLTVEQVRERLEQTIERNPELAGQELTLDQRRQVAEEIRRAHSAAQRWIAPGRSHTYRFTGLDQARLRESTLTLRYRFHILRSDEHETYPAVFYFNGDQRTARRATYVPTMSHVQLIPPDYVREDGTMEITVVNLHQPPPDRPSLGALNFEEADFELLYKVANFEGNFFRAVVVSWVKLAFLAMLGIASATFLSFAVACLLSFTIFMAGTLGPFLAISLEEYYPADLAQMDWSNIGMVIQWAFESTIRGIAQFLVFALRSFGDYSPTQHLVEGRLIPWSGVAGGLATFGLLWSGIALIVGYIVLRSRQLAIYSGQG